MFGDFRKQDKHRTLAYVLQCRAAMFTVYTMCKNKILYESKFLRGFFITVPNNNVYTEHSLCQFCTFPEGSPGSTMEGIQKKSSKTQYLYRQLCHIDKRLSLLGPSGFPTPHSHSRALQQIQGIKECLEDQLSTVRCVNPDETTQNKYMRDESQNTLLDSHVARYLQTVF